MDMRTDLTAVPHAGLGFHFLRVHVRTTGSWRSSRGSRAQKEENERRTNRLTTFRSHLQFQENIKSSRFLAWPLAIRKFGKLQVRPAGQAGYPISLVASLDTVPVKCCVPLLQTKILKARTVQKDPCDSKGYTHTPPRGEAKLRLGRVCKCARSKDKRVKT